MHHVYFLVLVCYLVMWNISSFSNGGTTLPLTWLLTTSFNVTESLNGALLTVILNYLDGNATSIQTTSQITFDFYSIFTSTLQLL